MTTTVCRGCSACALVVVLAAFAAWHSSATEGSPPVAQPKDKQKPTRMYYGVLACSNSGCHNKTGKPNQEDIILCDYEEVRIWSMEDKHKDANKVLKSERGLQMARLLGIKGDIAREPSCVSCHGVLVDDPKLVHKPSFKLEEGVSCGACHGMAKEWVARHSDFLERESWRALKRSVKEEQFGMKDLWDPEKRAVLCASCHVGNAAEGKVVTHTMYAAGHPPLPGFEAAAFSDSMPRHWKYLAEKSPQVQKILEYDPARSDLERTQLAVVSGLVSFRESMNLLEAQATLGADAKDAERSWPELAQFDCYACHHDLKSKSWRQERGYKGTPGRPDMRAWPTALVRLAILHAGKDDADKEKKLTKEMHDVLKELTDAYNAQPFGDARQVAKAAHNASKWATGLLAEIRAERFDAPAARRLLAGLGKESKSRLMDFDSARQLSWAFLSIHADVEKSNGKNAEVAKLIQELDEQLKLTLPRGQVEIARDYLKETLEKLNSYEPEPFQRRFDLLLRKVQSKDK